LQLAAPEEKDERKAATEAERAKRAIKARKKGRVSALVAEAADGAETDPESAATPVGSVAKAALANGDGTGDDGAASKVRSPLSRHIMTVEGTSKSSDTVMIDMSVPLSSGVTRVTTGVQDLGCLACCPLS
jgi:hypothetical protein